MNIITINKGNKMSKKLKIQFWKAEKAFAMQTLEQEGLPKNFIGPDAIRLFSTNAERDEYLQRVVNSITDELFTGNRELKVGEMCEVRDDKDARWEKRKLIAVLPERYNERFIAENIGCSKDHCSWRYARPIAKRTEPTVEECGQLITYTWEEK